MRSPGESHQPAPAHGGEPDRPQNLPPVPNQQSSAPSEDSAAQESSPQTGLTVVTEAVMDHVTRRVRMAIRTNHRRNDRTFSDPLSGDDVDQHCGYAVAIAWHAANECIPGVRSRVLQLAEIDGYGHVVRAFSNGCGGYFIADATYQQFDLEGVAVAPTTYKFADPENYFPNSLANVRHDLHEPARNMVAQLERSGWAEVTPANWEIFRVIYRIPDSVPFEKLISAKHPYWRNEVTPRAYLRELKEARQYGFLK